jgi:hypothetical protein
MLCNWLVKLIVDNLAVGALIGAAWSFIVEMWPEFGNLPAATKRWTMFALCMAVPLLGLVVASFLLKCAEAAFSVDLLAQAIGTGLAAFAGSQAAHLRKL